MLQQKLLTTKLSAVCTVYKQWFANSGYNCGLRTAVKTQDTIPYFTNRSSCFYITTNITVIILFLLLVYKTKTNILVEYVKFVRMFCMGTWKGGYIFCMKPYKKNQWVLNPSLGIQLNWFCVKIFHKSEGPLHLLSTINHPLKCTLSCHLHWIISRVHFSKISSMLETAIYRFILSEQ